MVVPAVFLFLISLPSSTHVPSARPTQLQLRGGKVSIDLANFLAFFPHICPCKYVMAVPAILLLTSLLSGCKKHTKAATQLQGKHADFCKEWYMNLGSLKSILFSGCPSFLAVRNSSEIKVL
jgi:hypothetical protein